MSLANPRDAASSPPAACCWSPSTCPPRCSPCRAGRPDLPLDQVDSFIAIAADGKVTAFCGHASTWRIRTALAQIVAEELTSRSSRSR